MTRVRVTLGFLAISTVGFAATGSVGAQGGVAPAGMARPQGLTAEQRAAASSTDFVWPASGHISWNANHHKHGCCGIAAENQYAEDIASAGSNVPVVAAYDGVVVGSFNDQSPGTCVVAGKPHGLGNVVVIRHDGGYYSMYGHLKWRLVDEGDHVSQGMHIGIMGQTGCASGQHVHFEIGTQLYRKLITAASTVWNAPDPPDENDSPPGTPVTRGSATGGSYAGLAHSISQYVNHIVENSTHVSWLVQRNLHRNWVQNTAVWGCLTGRGFTDVGAVGNSVLEQLHDDTGRWAQCAGDSNHDGIVDILDLSIMAADWGCPSAKDRPCTEWWLSDFNHDAVVNIGDLSVLAHYWGSGVASFRSSLSASLSPSSARGLLQKYASAVSMQKQQSASANGPPATIYLTPSASTLALGSVISVDIRANVGDEEANAVKVSLTYPSKRLALVNTDVAAATWSITAKSNGGGGRASLDLGTTTPTTGDQLVGTVTFQAIGTGTAKLSFDSSTNATSSDTFLPFTMSLGSATYSIAPPKVLSFSADPTLLPASGGTTSLNGAVANASACVFSVRPMIVGFPQSVDCSGGTASTVVSLPANTSSTRKSYRFTLTASALTKSVKSKTVTASVAPPT